MNPLYLRFLLAAIRLALKAGGVAGLAVSDNDLTTALSAAATFIGIVWSIYTGWKSQQKLATAAAMPPSTISEVEQVIREGGAAPASTPTDVMPLMGPLRG